MLLLTVKVIVMTIFIAIMPIPFLSDLQYRSRLPYAIISSSFSFSALISGYIGKYQPGLPLSIASIGCLFFSLSRVLDEHGMIAAAFTGRFLMGIAYGLILKEHWRLSVLYNKKISQVLKVQQICGGLFTAIGIQIGSSSLDYPGLEITFALLFLILSLCVLSSPFWPKTKGDSKTRISLFIPSLKKGLNSGRQISLFILIITFFAFLSFTIAEEKFLWTEVLVVSLSFSIGSLLMLVADNKTKINFLTVISLLNSLSLVFVAVITRLQFDILVYAGWITFGVTGGIFVGKYQTWLAIYAREDSGMIRKDRIRNVSCHIYFTTIGIGIIVGPPFGFFLVCELGNQIAFEAFAFISAMSTLCHAYWAGFFNFLCHDDEEDGWSTSSSVRMSRHKFRSNINFPKIEIKKHSYKKNSRKARSWTENAYRQKNKSFEMSTFV